MSRAEDTHLQISRWAGAEVACMIDLGYISEWPFEITRAGWRYLREKNRI